MKSDIQYSEQLSILRGFVDLAARDLTLGVNGNFSQERDFGATGAGIARGILFQVCMTMAAEVAAEENPGEASAGMPSTVRSDNQQCGDNVG